MFTLINNKRWLGHWIYWFWALLGGVVIPSEKKNGIPILHRRLTLVSTGEIKRRIAKKWMQRGQMAWLSLFFFVLWPADAIRPLLLNAKKKRLNNWKEEARDTGVFNLQTEQMAKHLWNKTMYNFGPLLCTKKKLWTELNGDMLQKKNTSIFLSHNKAELKKKITCDSDDPQFPPKKTTSTTVVNRQKSDKEDTLKKKRKGRPEKGEKKLKKK